MKELYKKQKIVCNKIMCRRCGEIIESKTVLTIKHANADRVPSMVDTII